MVALVVVVMAAASWWAWMGWDTSYQIDPDTGARTGPYATWQVIGCAVTLVVTGVAAARVLPLWVLLPALVIPFVASWSVTAMALADSGLWAIGLILLLVGMTAATFGLGALARWGWKAVDARKRGELSRRPPVRRR